MALRVTKNGFKYDSKDVLNSCNYLEHKDFCKGKEGYFACSLRELDEQIDDHKTSYLHDVYEDSVLLFESSVDVENNCSSLFLPVEKVQPRKYKIELNGDELELVLLSLGGNRDQDYPYENHKKIDCLQDNIVEQYDAQKVHE